MLEHKNPISVSKKRSQTPLYSITDAVTAVRNAEAYAKRNIPTD